MVIVLLTGVDGMRTSVYLRNVVQTFTYLTSLECNLLSPTCIYMEQTLSPTATDYQLHTYNTINYNI